MSSDVINFNIVLPSGTDSGVDPELVPIHVSLQKVQKINIELLPLCTGDALKTNQFKFPIGALEEPDGVITVFHLAGGQIYLTGKVGVLYNGQELIRGEDFSELANRTGVTLIGFTPQTGDTIDFWYIEDLTP